MSSITRLTVASSLAAAVLAVSAGFAGAATPASTTKAWEPNNASQVTQAHYRPYRHRHRHGYYGGYWGPRFGFYYGPRYRHYGYGPRYRW